MTLMKSSPSLSSGKFCMTIKLGNYIVIMGLNFETPLWNIFSQTQGFLMIYPLLELPNKMGRNKTLIEAGRNMVVDVGIPLSFLAEAGNMVCYTQNWSIIVKHHEKIAYELLKGRKPDISYFLGFRCFEAKDDEGVFLVIFEYHHVIPGEDGISNQDDSAQSNTNEISNPRILQDQHESQISGDVTYGILTRSKVRSNFYMFVNHVSMIEQKTIIKAMQDELNKFERHHVWTLVPKHQGKSIIVTRWVFRNKMDKYGSS
uniref:Uncharacterized protein n=1 Tax=Lactuca sativa TaxID=4236 RepID=A0A9R1X6V0_LACSA|nr:hypothetical protein LSAT_V11C600312650 [Lactuca sativa]